jgi:hypothetical protein
MGASLVGLGAVSVPLLLGGYASALSLVMPRVASIVALICCVPYLALGFLGMFRYAMPILVMPSGAVIIISIGVLLWSQSSVWQGVTTRAARIVIGLIVTLPPLFATWWLGSFLLGLLSS